MSLKEFLQYKLIHTENFTLTTSKIILILLAIALTYISLYAFKKFLKRRITKQGIDKGSVISIYLIVKYFAFVILAVFVLDVVGVKITALLASFAALLVGVGLGLQAVFSDIASGLVLLFERNLTIDDVIELQDGLVGRVVEINLRTSNIVTRDDVQIIVPNSKFVNHRIVNWTHGPIKSTRFFVQVHVAYGSDVQVVKNVLLETATNHSKIMKNKKPFVRFNNFGDSALEFQLFFWTNKAFVIENIKSDLRFSIDEVFRKNNIKIPFPQQDIHIINPTDIKT